jgi:putative endopeptidase
MKDADCEGALQLLEEMRELFAQRIRNLDWLSDATKDKALEKLQAMGFNVGGPKELINAKFKLTGKTPVEDVLQYKKQADEYLRNELVGKPGGEYEWEYLLLSPNGTSIDAVNAFYDPASNQLVILPVFLQGELFPADKNNVMRYVTLMSFGHEMTHGFDGMGASYDAEGNKVDWWTAEDKAKFQQRQQMMVERYNELEQVPGVNANGEKTKNENIADLGGFNLAWELWNRKLKSDGLTGESLRHQQRQFFLAFTHFWQASSTEEYLKEQLETDFHSANHNRINGVVRLMDDWYTLFGISPDDKLYVAPEKRVKIW